MMTKDDARILLEDVERESKHGRTEYADVFGPSYAREALQTVIAQADEIKRLRARNTELKNMMFAMPVQPSLPLLDNYIQQVKPRCACEPNTVCGNAACPLRMKLTS